MTCIVRPLTCGWMTADANFMVQGQEGRMRFPVAAFLVEHPQGLVLFDSGMHAELMTSTERLKAVGSIFDIELTEEGLVRGQLAALGVDPADVAVAVASHLHYDHCGGLAQVPNARMVVQQTEWDAAHDPGAIEIGGYNPDDFELGHDRQMLDGDHDLFGDGSLVLHTSIGHTAGHQSLLVDGRVLLVGDACYCRLALDTDQLPAFSFDAERQRAGFAWMRQQQAAGVQLVFSHDAPQWATLGPTI